MAYTIAISGKGGTGKTTTAALLIKSLVRQTGKSVLAVDADPNACLALALGVETHGAVADVREEMLEKKLRFPQGMSKERYIEYSIQQSLAENEGVFVVRIDGQDLLKNAPGLFEAAAALRGVVEHRLG